jgi:hypothetical protein
MMFNHALRHRWAKHNPAQLAKKLRPSAATAGVMESNVLNPAEINSLLDACDA